MSSTAPPPAPGLAATVWAFFSNPYVFSAVACGALALALSRLLSAAPPPRDAKCRAVAGDVRRVGNAQFVFKSPSHALPDLLLDADAARVVALHPKKSAPRDDHPAPASVPTSASAESRTGDRPNPHDPDADPDVQVDAPRPRRAPRLSISLPLRSALFCKDDFREQTLADVHDLRVLERGLHFQGGRAVAIGTGVDEQETVLQFNSRVGAESFMDLLYHVKTRKLKRPEKVSLFLTTFNVGNSQPPDDLSPWLARAAAMDVVAIAAQECSYTATSSPLAGSLQRAASEGSSKQAGGSASGATEATPLLDGDTDSEGDISRILSSPKATQSYSSTSMGGKEHWHTLLSAHFPEDEYACIAKLSAWDRCLNIFVKRKLLPAVSRVRSDTANVGLGGVAGNKGAIGARFTVFDTDFVIINSHLAAHAKEVNRRNEDFASITGGLWNLRDNAEVDILATAVHHLFWMGDLNYRIDLERDKVLELVEKKDWESLREGDQLIKEMAAGRAFQGFEEGRTDFRPTYRYTRGSREYTAVKMRTPSYCDRILYRSLAGCKVALQEYLPADEIQTSDHSPVYGVFEAELVHTRGTRDLEAIAMDNDFQEARDLGLMSPIVSPRTLSMRALLPGFSSLTRMQLQFKSLSASGIPEMDHGGRRLQVAKALHIHNHVGWKKHEELGAGKHADPYCAFHGDAVAELDEGEYRTRTVVASQNPVWEAESLPGIDLLSSASHSIGRRYVVITVRDEIPTRRDDVIGSAVLWLGSGGRGSGLGALIGNEPVEFRLPLMLGGKRQGEIQGSYIVKRT